MSLEKIQSRPFTWAFICLALTFLIPNEIGDKGLALGVLIQILKHNFSLPIQEFILGELPFLDFLSFLKDFLGLLDFNRLVVPLLLLLREHIIHGFSRQFRVLHEIRNYEIIKHSLLLKVNIPQHSVLFEQLNFPRVYL